jgi:hypothetical protein
VERSEGACATRASATALVNGGLSNAAWTLVAHITPNKNPAMKKSTDWMTPAGTDHTRSLALTACLVQRRERNWEFREGVS